jgi:hypothetical protein
MSQENLEIVRAAHDAFNRGDIDAAFEGFPQPGLFPTWGGRVH